MSNSITFTPEPTGSNAPEPSPAPNAKRPEWLPENMATVEDFTKSYRELQASHTQARQELAKLKGDAPADPPPADEPAPDASEAKPEGTNDDGEDDDGNQDEEAAKKVAEAAGFDLAPFQSEYDQSGEVSEESRAKIAEGLKSVLGEDARQIVDSFIEGQKAVHTNDRGMFMDAAGGEQNYSTMTEWAAKSLPEDEIAAYNRQIESGDRHSTLFAIQSLKSKYEAANGRLSNITVANGGATSSSVGYKSTAEMTADMENPKYKTDPAFREAIKAKIAASGF
jgi:hypothetical protein